MNLLKLPKSSFLDVVFFSFNFCSMGKVRACGKKQVVNAEKFKLGKQVQIMSTFKNVFARNNHPGRTQTNTQSEMVTHKQWK